MIEQNAIHYNTKKSHTIWSSFINVKLANYLKNSMVNQWNSDILFSCLQNKVAVQAKCFNPWTLVLDWYLQQDHFNNTIEDIEKTNWRFEVFEKILPVSKEANLL